MNKFLQTPAQIKGLLRTYLDCASSPGEPLTIAVDTETTGLDWKQHNMLGMSVASPLYAGGFFFLLPQVKDRTIIAQVMGDTRIKKVFHNAKFDMHFLAKAGMRVSGPVEDTYGLAKLWNENLPNHKLKDLCRLIFGQQAGDEQDALKEWLAQNKKTFSDLASVPKDILAAYGAQDALLTIKLWDFLRSSLAKQGIPDKLIERESATLMRAFSMEELGVAVDVPFLTGYSAELAGQQAEVLAELHELSGTTEWNPESDDDVAKIIEGFGITLTKTTKEGKLSVDKHVLEGLDHPFAGALMKHRRLGTVRSTFVEGILTRQVDGVVHTNYNTSRASTGRWSSTDPNLQNVDNKSDARKGIVPRPGHVLVGFDFKQIEPIVFASYAGERIQQAFAKGLDYHTFNASMAYGVAYEDVTPAQRKVAKALGLAIMYGSGAAKAASMMGVPLEEGRAILARYYAALPEVKKFQKEVIRVIEDRAIAEAKSLKKLNIVDWKTDWRYNGTQLPMRDVPWQGQVLHFVDKAAIQERGWVKNKFGRLRRLTCDEAYKGLNALCQSEAGDLLKEAMMRCTHVPVLQVHDELVFEFKIETHLQDARLTLGEMKSVQDLYPTVPIGVDVALYSKNWGTEEEIQL